jgi:hypothetical protein
MAPTRAWRSRCRSCPASDGFAITTLQLHHEVEVATHASSGPIKTVALRHQIELGHRHVCYGVRAPMRTTAAITMSPKATDARRVMTLAVGLMVSSIETGWGSPNHGNKCELWTQRRTMSIGST